VEVADAADAVARSPFSIRLSRWRCHCGRPLKSRIRDHTVSALASTTLET
jgi:hypothetical protein